MKEIRNLQLSAFQKQVINKLDDEYCYEIYTYAYDETIKIFNKKMELIITINKRDNSVSENNRLEDYKKRIKLLELILKEEK
ncbi:hypothetical protein SKUN_00611 [Spiroplasma kunkelii CR2-3x]|uniref:Uncharacterized protein n=1 Tax=Spiroplasma kunkelii CR2-3x TaxID=273035 RepID=A0A0K2JFY5_SPIKU|nr:hypothetical protein [Spiroplasma kunkelii]ALA97504.1 hypothetical protein SKUN_00611 [Spiroplasma kunkelii CR2-3x]